LEDAKVMQGLY